MRSLAGALTFIRTRVAVFFEPVYQECMEIELNYLNVLLSSCRTSNFH